MSENVVVVDVVRSPVGRGKPAVPSRTSTLSICWLRSSGPCSIGPA